MSSAFDKVIGYEDIKRQLLQVVDILKNPKRYENLGAKQPKGCIIYGAPGLGKTLLAKSFIAESGLPSFQIKRTKGVKLIDTIADTFEKAKENAPSIVFIDDIEKLSNEDSSRCDTPEYIAIQSGMDGSKGVFVIATSNAPGRLPKSLVRAGRLGMKLEVGIPNKEDSEKIIRYYLSNKKLSSGINFNDIAGMISYSSCAELENILNEAAINAGYQKKSSIDIECFVKAVLEKHYQKDCDFEISDGENKKYEKTVVHEVGHIIVSEVLKEGSVGLVAVYPLGENDFGGFVHRRLDFDRRPYKILVSLAGYASHKLCYSDVPSGTQTDLEKATNLIRSGIGRNATCGFSTLSVGEMTEYAESESLLSRTESIVQAELERYLKIATEILMKNSEFYDELFNQLYVKKVLLTSDIKQIRESVTITEVAV